MKALKKDLHFTSCLNKTSINLSEKDKQKALDVLEKTTLPTRKVEAWKYTRTTKLGKINFINKKETINDLSSYVIDDTNCSFVFINGHFSKEHSSQEIPKGLIIRILSTIKDEFTDSSLKIENDIFNAINTAHLTDGIKINVLSNNLVEKPIQIIHILKGNSTISNFKIIINAESSSQASFIQGFFSESGDNNFCNYTSEINLSENAVLKIDKIQSESEKSFHISTEQINQNKNSNFRINTFTLNGGLVRNNLNVIVNGENCETHLNGAYLLKNKQHVDNHSLIDHKISNCESNELYKGIIDDSSTAVFNGKVFVRPNAQKINAFQANSNILLSDKATINSKPELEIYADDVKCSHGSTTGQLDEDALFYLRARGLSEKSARDLMIAAFIKDVMTKVENKNIKRYIDSLLKIRFGWKI